MRIGVILKTNASLLIKCCSNLVEFGYQKLGNQQSDRLDLCQFFAGLIKGAGLIYQSGGALRGLLEFGSYWRASLIRSFTVCMSRCGSKLNHGIGI